MLCLLMMSVVPLIRQYANRNMQISRQVVKCYVGDVVIALPPASNSSVTLNQSTSTCKRSRGIISTYWTIINKSNLHHRLELAVLYTVGVIAGLDLFNKVMV